MKKTVIFLVFLCVASMTMQAQQRLVLVEEFTASTCGPCAQLNALLNPWLVTNAEKMTIIKYQMNWPGAGDPYYTAEGGVRRGYYGVNSVPAVYVNGSVISSGSTYQTWLNNIATAVNNAYTQPAQATITGNFKVNGNNIIINGSITPLISGSGYRIYVVVNEKKTTGNKGSNGEQEFHHVMMKMLPNGNGTDVTLTEGTAIPFSYTHDMSSTFVEEMDDLEVAVFVQNTSSRAVLNAVYIEDISLPAPQNMTATQTQIDHLNVNLTWSPPSGATPNGYNIYRNNVKLNTSPITTTSYQDVAPEYGQIYTYAVGAVTNGDEGYWATDTVLTNVNIPLPVITTVKQIRGLQMLVEWEMPETTFPVKFRVYRNYALQNPPGLTEETSIINIGNSYSQYCFQIEPVVNSINGTRSNNVCITLLNIPQPTNLKAEQISIASKKVLLTWDGSVSNTAGYNIYRNGIQINTELVTERAYTDAVSELGVEYLYQVYGVAGTGAESDKCGETKITLSSSIPPPANVHATQNNNLNVMVAWNAVTFEDLDGYNIYRDGEKINTTLVTGIEYSDMVPDEGNYCYKVTTVVAGNESEPSAPACVEVKLGICEPDKNALFSLYPNPVSGILNIKTDETIIDCKIFNIQGQLIYSTQSNVKEIATDSWASGVYIMRITTDKGSAEKRFSKN
ncbi:MAG: T9SS type A sorting domain-containing protein [Lentimicrobiaceae bacterium]|nr:T9SS type A sorting domain-containing protein [Lentimicrobiaceae bacterium]